MIMLQNPGSATIAKMDLSVTNKNKTNKKTTMMLYYQQVEYRYLVTTSTVDINRCFLSFCKCNTTGVSIHAREHHQVNPRSGLGMDFHELPLPLHVNYVQYTPCQWWGVEFLTLWRQRCHVLWTVSGTWVQLLCTSCNKNTATMRAKITQIE